MADNKRPLVHVVFARTPGGDGAVEILLKVCLCCVFYCCCACSCSGTSLFALLMLAEHRIFLMAARHFSGKGNGTRELYEGRRHALYADE